MEISRNNPENKSIIIQGTHLFPGCDVSVYINNIFVSNVGDTQDFTCFYTPKTEGYYNATLRINQNGTIIILAYTDPLFTVTLIGGEQPEEQQPFLPEPLSYIAGTLLTIFLLALPLMIIGKYKIENDVARYSPIFTGCLGFILSCLVGFFPWYAIFVLIFILTLVIIIMWLQRKMI
jgi:hypothetical protein